MGKPTDHQSLILLLDKWQGRPDAQVCPVEPRHGKLTPHISGSALVCGECKHEMVGVAVTNEMLAEAEEWVSKDRSGAFVGTTATAARFDGDVLGARMGAR